MLRKPTIHGQECLELRSGKGEKLAVLDPGPAAASYRLDVMAEEEGG